MNFLRVAEKRLKILLTAYDIFGDFMICLETCDICEEENEIFYV